MRNLVFLTILSVLMIGGCGSELTTGAAGLGVGFAASETMKGIEADLAKREQELLDRYAAAVESGAKQETLDELEDKITKTQYAREGVKAGKKILGIDWNDPYQAGDALSNILFLGYAIFTKRKLIKTESGVNRFMAKEDSATAGRLYDSIARKKA